MKITAVKTFLCNCFRTNWVFVKIETDSGIHGWGEATLEYKEKALVGAVEHIREYLVGKNPLDIEKHFHDIYRDAYWRGGPVLMSALAGVEMALWDIIPPEEGSDFCHRLVYHGRAVCTARTKPYCDKCCLADICAKNGVE